MEDDSIDMEDDSIDVEDDIVDMEDDSIDMEDDSTSNDMGYLCHSGETARDKGWRPRPARFGLARRQDAEGVLRAGVQARHHEVHALVVAAVQRRTLQLKATFESGSSYCSFKRWNQSRSTRGQPGVNMGSTWGQPASPRSFTFTSSIVGNLPVGSSRVPIVPFPA